MNADESSPPSTAPSTSHESTSPQLRPSSRASTASETSMEFNLYLLRTGDEEDDIQIWAVPVPPYAHAEPHTQEGQPWMENAVAEMPQSDTFPVEADDALVSGKSRKYFHISNLGDVPTDTNAADENPRVVVAHDAGYDGDDSSGIEEENVNEGEDNLFWIDVYWDMRNGPLEEATGHRES
ncbi:hypothetical protein BO94DRAFT_533193 [Aspergillus sclerotioniger CBS 115572]|uniref:Uncharacterized protein n=1 Tax=Aspergillus sclerotioniger CBS 115572 TaxID=1450535 RepID=A0A317X2L5_9EURO|nr:hypothetical protein BO94DRAFT_533193 [Aspergillus sclerotioniger CBS 115572]PWY91737.1 hypothetical protein BO94DRAFT_533193 [Aspergillus sclerotioniger CBS 115572]